MSRSWWWRLALLVFFVVVAFIYVFPTGANLNLETTKFPYKKKVNLGLDLQGGLYMVYGVDFKKVYQDKLLRAVDGLAGELVKAGVDAKVGTADSSIEEDPKVHLKFDAASATKVDEMLEKQKYTLRAVDRGDGDYVIAMARDYRATMKENTLNQSLQVIRNRIDEFGVAEPSVVTKGDNRVVVELPGVRDVERAKALVGRTARLEFKMVNMDARVNLPVLIAQAEKDKGFSYKEGAKFSEYLAQVNSALKGKIPEDSQVLFERKPGNINVPYLLYSKVEMSGAELVDAMVGFDQNTQSPEVDFQLSPRGAVTFGDLTRASVGKSLAIVLDDVIYSAPRINSPIPNGRGMITVGGMGDAAFKDARDLAIVLRAGALPAQLDLLEQRVIGPSIGADSIHRGLTASLVGCSLIFIFMSIYYRMSGLVAVISLILNGLFTFAVLIGIDATLTLPGIAGLALTIGMAVDSNVIIFERIRDELMEGKTVVGAVQAGFDKAFSCIFDANITHAIVAVILLNFGSGPIRGFAVTLLIGIMTTLFCAVTVCKLFFDGYLGWKNQNVAKLSI
jgi:protein-export membrane protein SecD